MTVATTPPAQLRYWLVKSEPDVYPWTRLVDQRRTRWDGVRNYTARNHLRAMRAGDEVLFYHSNDGKEIVGVARVVREGYDDPTAPGQNWTAVDLEPVRSLARPVPLTVLRATRELARMQLLTLGRLSVTAITPAEFALIDAYANGSREFPPPAPPPPPRTRAKKKSAAKKTPTKKKSAKKSVKKAPTKKGSAKKKGAKKAPTAKKSAKKKSAKRR